VTGIVAIAAGDRARWQRQAAAELRRILDAHGELPAIAWTVGPAGCVLAGRVSGLAPAGQVREAFTAWRQALALDDCQEQAAGGQMVHLRASARRGMVHVRVTATLFAAEEW
jgi:hypothetical protein